MHADVSESAFAMGIGKLPLPVGAQALVGAAGSDAEFEHVVERSLVLWRSAETTLAVSLVAACDKSMARMNAARPRASPPACRLITDFRVIVSSFFAGSLFVWRVSGELYLADTPSTPATSFQRKHGIAVRRQVHVECNAVLGVLILPVPAMRRRQLAVHHFAGDDVFQTWWDFQRGNFHIRRCGRKIFAQ